MHKLVYESSNSFGQMSIMPLEETNWEGGEGIIDHNNPITLHNNTSAPLIGSSVCRADMQMSFDICSSVRPSVEQLITSRIKYSGWAQFWRSYQQAWLEVSVWSPSH
jgi:hypothetical protein